MPSAHTVAAGALLMNPRTTSEVKHKGTLALVGTAPEETRVKVAEVRSLCYIFLYFGPKQGDWAAVWASW